MQTAAKPRKTPRQARSQVTVEAILETTARVLGQRGYAGTNTNRVAELAGVSVGSIYQYFPNKTALVAALHERHVRQLNEEIERGLAASRETGLAGQVRALVGALVAAHRLEPELHRVLEREFPFLELPYAESEASQAMHARICALLAAHRDEVAVADLELAGHMVLNMIESLVHAAVLEPPPGIAPARLEGAIADALLGYLSYRPAGAA